MLDYRSVPIKPNIPSPILPGDLPSAHVKCHVASCRMGDSLETLVDGDIHYSIEYVCFEYVNVNAKCKT